MSEYVLAIDPGTKESGVVLVRREDYKPLASTKISNGNLYETYLMWLQQYKVQPYAVDVVIEMIQGRFAQGFGAELLETAVWIGRFTQHFMFAGIVVSRVFRMEECKALCANIYPRNDKGVKAALVDRFAYGQPNYGKGTKKDPGWFYGFSEDIWAAYAVAVTFIDKGGDEI